MIDESPCGGFGTIPPMTRLEAERMALEKGRVDRSHNYMAKQDNVNGGWKVYMYPVNNQRVRSRD